MKIKNKHIAGALDGIVAAFICVVVQICGDQLGLSVWASAGLGIVLGLFAGRAISDALFDWYMARFMRRMAKKVYQEREGGSD